MCKTLEIYQQTFIQNTSNVSSLKCRFTRVMKTKHSQFFVVKCLGINKLGGEASELFLRGFASINGVCNTQSNTQPGNNHVFLGSLDSHTSIEPSFMVDELPLSDFEVIRERNGLAINGQFAVSFQIELREDI